MKTVACTVRCSAGGLAAGDRTGDKIADATRSCFAGRPSSAHKKNGPPKRAVLTCNRDGYWVLEVQAQCELHVALGSHSSASDGPEEAVSSDGFGIAQVSVW